MGLIGRILSFVRTQRNGAQISDVKTDPGGGPNVTAEHFAPAGDDAHPLPDDYVYAARSPQRGRYAAVGYVDTSNASKAQPGEKRIYSRDSGGTQKAEVWLKADGTVVCENENGRTTLAPDGSFTAESPAGTLQLTASGQATAFNASGSATLTPDGSFAAVNAAGSMTLAANGSILGQNAAGQFALQDNGNFVVNGVTIAPGGSIVAPGGIQTPSAEVNGVEVAGHTHAQANDSGGNTEQDTGPMQ